MKTLNLCLHCGGKEVALEDLAKVPTPEPTATHFPIPHVTVRDEVRRAAEASGFLVRNEVAATNRSGAHGFGLLQLEAPDHNDGDFGMVAAWRNAHDMSFAATLGFGSMVFVCDNLVFDAEVKIARKHTKNILNELPSAVDLGMSSLVGVRGLQQIRIDKMRELDITNVQANDLIVRAFDSGVIGSNRVGKVLNEWKAPSHPEFAEGRNLWRLFNAFTESFKGLGQVSLSQRSRKLHSLFDQEVGLNTLLSA